jgi:hypothetical protein
MNIVILYPNIREKGGNRNDSAVLGIIKSADQQRFHAQAAVTGTQI